MSNASVLWYDQPATRPGDADSDDGFRNSPAWLRALPLGNGSLGAMVYGDVAVERVRLNEETLWSGVPQDADNPDALAALPEIQRLLIERRYAEAQRLTYEKMVCRGAGTGNGHGFNVPYGSYQTLGDLRIAFDGHDAEGVEDYRRELWLATAAAHVEYRVGELIYRRDFFVSHPHQVLAMRLTCRRPGMQVDETLPGHISFTATLSRPEQAEVHAERGSVAMRGRLSDGSGEDGDAPRGMSYVARLRAIAEGGTVTAGPNGLRVEGADAVTLLLAAATDYGRTVEEAETLVRERIARAARTPYRSLLDAHVRDHSALFTRVSLTLDPEDPHRTLPTDERLARVRAGESDTNLAALFFDYGRYLLLASSREDSVLPANLQGVWAEGIDTAWSCDYHHDINDQMNYWPAEPTNLSECHRPFLRFIRSLAGPGAKTASVHYGIEDGWVVHTISNVWGFTSPGEAASWGQFPAATAWLCRHLWEHYEYTGDRAFLSEAFPTMAGAARFFLGFLVEDPTNGHLVTAPSNSPENAFFTPDGGKANVCLAPTMDNQILRDFFGSVADACRVLNTEPDLARRVTEARSRLAPTRVGKHGQVMEWLEDFDEPEPGHRHVSHLFGLHPAAEITPEGTPELAGAARVTLERRLAHGGAHTGWSRAWLINFYARLGDGDAALSHLNLLLAKSTADNLFDLHPPFQIDGNFGAAAGVTEMLLQSHGGVIRLLPALPRAWSEGRVTGLRARGGVTVDMQWRDGKLTAATVIADRGGTFAVRLPGEPEPRTLELQAGIPWRFVGEDGG